MRHWLAITGLLFAHLLAAAQPVWFDGGRPTAQAQLALDWLTDAASHGLRAEDYGSAELRRAVGELSASATPDTIAGLDERLTHAVRRYLTHLHQGRIDPRTIHHDFAVARADAFDAGRALNQALAQGQLVGLDARAAPQMPLYGALRSALAQYRALADHPAWQRELPGARRSIAPGDNYAGLDLLAQRLQLLGDLAREAPTPATYAGPVVDAVRGFQQRHALAIDGVVGPATRRQLDVTPRQRARQIALTMERLRWTPLMQGRRMVVINIPEFVLRAYEVRDGRIVVEQTMKVVVGKALDTRTPLFDEDMRFIEFSPYWNVPPSIARDETVPALRRDPSIYERDGFEFVTPTGGVVHALTRAHLDAVLAGRLRLRQRPGPRNVLGGVKFVFPNRNHIFLHHTSATRLFERERRDFSHGCIRVEDPVGLARFVLQPSPAWTEDRIRAAMQQGASETIRLDEPVPVLIAYGTTLIKQGRIQFFDDLYGLDQVLDAALRQRPAPRATN